MRVALMFSWSSLGDVGLDAGRLVFPRAPERPAVYRLDLGGRVYIGETDQLRRRFQHHRTPGPSQRTNIRLNEAMVEVLDRGGRVAASVVLEATVDVDGSIALCVRGFSGTSAGLSPLPTIRSVG